MVGKLGGKIFAVDFDGTCVGHSFPNVGRSIGAEKVLRRIVAGGGRIVLWTLRRGAQLHYAVTWFEKNGIELYGINRCPDQVELEGNLMTGPSPKVSADIFIDDRALGAPLRFFPGERKMVINWLDIERFVFGDIADA